MDNRLKFESHINSICGKLAKFNGLLIKGKLFLEKCAGQILQLLCKANHFVRFHCIWCNTKKLIRKNICHAKTYF